MRVKFTAWAQDCALQTAKLVLGPTEHLIDWIRGSRSLVIKQLVCEVDSATTSCAVINDEWNCKSPASIFFVAGTVSTLLSLFTHDAGT